MLKCQNNLEEGFRISYTTLLLATNCGSLYCCVDPPNTLLVFASERFIQKTLCKYSPSKTVLSEARIFPVRSDEAYWVQ